MCSAGTPDLCPGRQKPSRRHWLSVWFDLWAYVGGLVYTIALQPACRVNVFHSLKFSFIRLSIHSMAGRSTHACHWDASADELYCLNRSIVKPKIRPEKTSHCNSWAHISSVVGMRCWRTGNLQNCYRRLTSFTEVCQNTKTVQKHVFIVLYWSCKSVRAEMHSSLFTDSKLLWS